jgi:hypothetical protein
MNISILTPLESNNEWFIYINEVLEKKFSEFGHKVNQIFFREINLELIKTLNNSNSDFYLSHSGIGSDINIFGEWDGPKNYWDVTKKKICILHFDHPFHCLQNHLLDTENALHIYSCGSYFTAAKLFCKKTKSNILLSPNPLLVDEKKKNKTEGNYFIIIKNLFLYKDFSEKIKNDKVLNSHCENISELVKNNLKKNAYFDHHTFILKYFADNNFESFVGTATIPDFYVWFLSEVSFNKISIIIEEIKEFPVRIYGEGISDYFKETDNLKIYPGIKADKSQDLYYSNFGIIDYSPTEGIHDRTQRAIFNERIFLSGTSPHEMNFYKNYNQLFYNFSQGNLAKKCEEIIKDPKLFQEKVVQFKSDYEKEFNWEDYINIILKNLDLKN